MPQQSTARFSALYTHNCILRHKSQNQQEHPSQHHHRQHAHRGWERYHTLLLNIHGQCLPHVIPADGILQFKCLVKRATRIVLTHPHHCPRCSTGGQFCKRCSQAFGKSWWQSCCSPWIVFSVIRRSRSDVFLMIHHITHHIISCNTSASSIVITIISNPHHYHLTKRSTK